ncbi:MAG: chorismate mutase [Alphaproteobacteria bacterium]|nr:chorismate mutase [Alphaproteobacteria bacterium]
MTNPQILKAEQCVSMEDVRAQIDRLDQALVGLLSERQRYIERAAEIKSNRDAVRDEARIVDVLSKVTARARVAGLNPDIAQAVWRVLIERSIALEFEAYDRQRAR